MTVFVVSRHVLSLVEMKHRHNGSKDAHSTRISTSTLVKTRSEIEVS